MTISHVHHFCHRWHVFWYIAEVVKVCCKLVRGAIVQSGSLLSTGACRDTFNSIGRSMDGTAGIWQKLFGCSWKHWLQIWEIDTLHWMYYTFQQLATTMTMLKCHWWTGGGTFRSARWNCKRNLCKWLHATDTMMTTPMTTSEHMITSICCRLANWHARR